LSFIDFTLKKSKQFTQNAEELITRFMMLLLLLFFCSTHARLPDSKYSVPLPFRSVRRDLSSGKRIDRSKSRATNERAKAEQQTQRQSQHQGSAVDADVVTSAPTRIREKQRRVEISDCQMA